MCKSKNIDSNADMSNLIAEVNNDYMRTMNKIIFD